MSQYDFFLTVVFFIYGLAFFSMGLLLMMEVWRAPALAERRILLPLAGFGFVHGFHEWLEMAIQLQQWLNLPALAAVEWLRLGLLALSFSLLMLFGLLSLFSALGYRPGSYWQMGIGLLGIYLLVALFASLTARDESGHWLVHADAFSRYLLAVPGAFLAALALEQQTRQALARRGRDLGLGLRMAGASFGVYSLTQLFVAPLDFFPANILNSLAFLNLTGFPIQIVRAAAAIVITYGILQALKFAEVERQRQFLAAQQARLEALEKVQQELLAHARLRQQLLRQAVVAQEEERGRIARELHDETAQYLTALSLNLATLRSIAPDIPRLRETLDRGQALLTRMSQGISRMARALRPAQLDDLGLGPAMQVLAEDMQAQFNLPISLEISDLGSRLEPLVETAVYRMAQEALTNAARHAQCQKITLRLYTIPDWVVLQVQDDGVGFDPQQTSSSSSGIGLAVMRERAQSIGGQLFIKSELGKGTLVEIRVPQPCAAISRIKEASDGSNHVDVG